MRPGTKSKLTLAQCPLNIAHDCTDRTSHVYRYPTLVRQACAWEDNEATQKRTPSAIERVNCYFT